MSSLEETDRASAAIATAPRVSLASIEREISQKCYVSALECFLAAQPANRFQDPGASSISLSIMTICILVMRNGFVVIGKAAPASPENFSAELGRKFAYEDAIRQLWPLMGYALKERLTKGSDAA